MANSPLVSDVDLFTDESLYHPYDRYRELRRMGAVVYLSRCKAYALTRFDVAREALADWRTFSSASGVTLNAEMNAFQSGKTLLGADPPQHTKLREIITPFLRPQQLRRLESSIAADADALVRELVERSEFDAVSELASVFPVRTVTDLLGLPKAPPRKLLNFADMHFNAFGPLGDHLEGPANARVVRGWAQMQKAAAFIHFVSQRLKPGGVGAAIYQAAGKGVITKDEADSLLSSLLVAGLDTTVRSIGAAVHCFATHPDQWRMLRADPAMLPTAFNEVLRFDSPSLALARSTTRDCEIGGYALPANARVLILFASANHDETRFEEPGAFRIDRKPLGNLSFGGGVHTCLGQALARIQAHAVIGALIRHAERLDLAAAPERLLNSVLRGYASLPVRVHPAAAASADGLRLAGPWGTEARSTAPIGRRPDADSAEWSRRQLQNWRRVVRSKRPPEEAEFWAGLADHSFDPGPTPVGVRSLGHGPNVLLLHGVGGRGSQFGRIARTLADQGWRAVMVDLHGPDDRRPRFVDVAGICGILEAVARREGGLAGLVAHSMGNLWAWYAIARGLRVERLVSLSGVFSGAWVFERYQRSYRLSDLDMLRFREVLAADGGDEPAWLQDPSVALTRVSRPQRALIVQGRDDAVVPADQGRAYASAWPEAAYLEIGEVSHEGVLTAGEAVAAVGALFGLADGCDERAIGGHGLRRAAPETSPPGSERQRILREQWSAQ